MSALRNARRFNTNPIHDMQTLLGCPPALLSCVDTFRIQRFVLFAVYLLPAIISSAEKSISVVFHRVTHSSAGFSQSYLLCRFIRGCKGLARTEGGHF